MLVCCAHKELASNPSYSDDKCASRSSHVTVAQSGPCRPMCGPLSLVSCMFVQLRMRDACAQAAASLGSGRQPRQNAAAWIPRGLCAPFGTSTVAPPDKLHVVLLEPHSRSTKASRDAGLVFLNTNLTRKGCTCDTTCDTAAAVRCPNWPLPAHMHPACAAARTHS
jgi:hypothetical protein